MIEDQLTHEIIGAAYQVHRVLGAGFLEKVYEKALTIELRNRGFDVSPQYPIPVFYEGIQVGDYFADLIVEGEIIVESKAVEMLTKAHEAQLVNYLQGIGFDIGLLINFGKSVEVKRKYRIYKRT